LPAVEPLDASRRQRRDGEPGILGLGLMERTVLAAHRAGYAQIFFLAQGRAAPPGTAATADWSRLADALSSQGAPLVIGPRTILAEPDWLRKLTATRIEPAAWAAIPGRLVVLAAAVLPDAQAVLQADGEASNMTAVEERLHRRFGPAAEIPNGIDPLVVAK